MFEPGMLVECIDDNPETGRGLWTGGPGNGALHGLRRLSIYTIRGIGRSFIGPTILLEEIIRPDFDRHYGEAGYGFHRFRPLNKERLSIFNAMLEPKEIEHSKELLRLHDSVKVTLTEIDEIMAASAIERDISG